MKRLVVAVLAGVVFGCGGGASGPPAVTPAMVSRSKQSWPEASQDALDKGRSTFMSKCKQCHALPKPTAKTAEEWPAQVEKMGKLAKLNQEQKDQVLHYLLAARDEK
jgi:cytochrome c5